MINRYTTIFVLALILLSGTVLSLNLGVRYTGEAFYISEGKAGIANPGEELPKEMTTINIAAWSIVLLALLGFIVTMHYLHFKENHKEKIVKKK